MVSVDNLSTFNFINFTYTIIFNKSNKFEFKIKSVLNKNNFVVILLQINNIKNYVYPILFGIFKSFTTISRYIYTVYKQLNHFNFKYFIYFFKDYIQQKKAARRILGTGIPLL